MHGGGNLATGTSRSTSKSRGIAFPDATGGVFPLHLSRWECVVCLVTATVSPALAFPVCSDTISRCAALRIAQADGRPISVARAWLLDHIDPSATFQNLDVKASGTVWN